MAKAVLRLKKLKLASVGGSAGHIAREIDTPHADSSKRHENITTGAVGSVAVRKAVIDRIQEATGGTDAKGRRHRSDAVVAFEIVQTAKAGWFEGKTDKEIKSWGAASYQWAQKKYGKENVVSGSMHLDESAVHLHLTVVPITADGRLSAKDVIGGRSDLSKLQTSYHKAVEKFGLERGLEGSKKSHVTPQQYREMLNKEIEQQTAPGGYLVLASTVEKMQMGHAALVASLRADNEGFRSMNAQLTAVKRRNREFEELTNGLTPEELKQALAERESLLEDTKAKVDGYRDEAAKMRQEALQAVEGAKTAEAHAEATERRFGEMGAVLKANGIHTPTDLKIDLKKANNMRRLEGNDTQATRPRSPTIG